MSEGHRTYQEISPHSHEVSNSGQAAMPLFEGMRLIAFPIPAQSRTCRLPGLLITSDFRGFREFLGDVRQMLRPTNVDNQEKTRYNHGAIHEYYAKQANQDQNIAKD